MARQTRSGAQHPSPPPPDSRPSGTSSDSETDQCVTRTTNKRKKSAKSSNSKSGTKSKSKRTRQAAVTDEPDPINTQNDYDLSDHHNDNNLSNTVMDAADDDDNDFLLPPSITRPIHNQSNSSNNSNPPATHNNGSTLLDSDTILPTIDNYKQSLNQWPEYQISSHMRGRRTGNVVPPKIFDELVAIQKIYRHHKALLAMMGNVSLYTLNKSIGEIGGKPGQDDYHLWMSYANEKSKHRMPNRGQKGVLGQRNKDVGAAWTALPEERRRVFDPQIFYTLSGLPKPINNDDGDEEGEEIVLQPEELVELQALYDEMVCKDKVAMVYAKVAAGLPQGPPLPEFNRKSLKCVEQLHKQIKNESNRMQFAYYLIASTIHAATEGKKSEPGWCREYTSNKDMADYLDRKANFATIFATHIQGLAVNEAVASQIGGKSTSTKQASPGDILKGKLAGKLRSEIDTLLKIKCNGFPRGPDPLGFDKMPTSTRQLWLDDLNKGFFKLKLKSAPDVTEDTETLQDNSHLEEANHPKSPTPNAQNECDDEDVEEEEEWGGIDMSSMVPF
ncbi:uncharacterized protein MELLADRAFT_88710 [Melampsora larici-populina 98AG31]|uniref:Uncharacterized protein n=1 Tax=Melampsora larici-populina (strain 98AG31 / pathotype 3-4-7) TaxID=747676 RepID=F4RSQ5_MELLP|nr:uncharacterized protein MELLADRAFT_88710 [Melampsora larici-populina 98AG31]EGG04654.1 hypothetical protein MELLADRAFT_88710 [Melampsora larici-populina 98AG31]